MTYVQPLRRSIDRARDMRKALTPPEARLWNALRRRAVGGLKFRRQHPIGPFIVDFFCPSAQLIVEVDGSLHTLADNPERELSTMEIGEMLMDRLRALDKIAYVRFASVYRDFQDVEAFLTELKDLLQRRG